MILLKLLQSLFKTLHSEGTPGQVAAGLALGAILGLTPLLSLHNAVVFAFIIMLNVSFPAAMFGWAVFTPMGFILDPLFDVVGHRLLLGTPALTPLWTSLYNTPVIPLTNFNNTVVLGSLTISLVLWVPLYLTGRWGVGRYRATVGAWLVQSRVYQLIKSSSLYNVYRWFKP